MEITNPLNRLSPGQKKMAVLAGAIAAIGVVAIIAVKVAENTGPQKRIVREKPDIQILTGKKDGQKLGIDALAARINSLERDNAQMEQKLNMISKSGHPGKEDPSSAAGPAVSLDAEGNPIPDTSAPALTDDDKAVLEQLRAKARKPEAPKITRAVPPAQVAPNPVQPSPVEASPAPAADAAKAESMEIRTYTTKTEKKSAPTADGDGDENPGKDKDGKERSAQKEKKYPDFQLPAGTIISGTLITGLDAPTASAARRDPYPSLLRIKAEAVLPNRYRMDIRECFMIASGYGELANERAMMRAEAISCVRSDGSIFESTLDAYAVGEDGKAGIRGRLVSKEGQIIARGLMGGFLGGIGNAMKPARIPTLSLNPGSTIELQHPDASTVAQESLIGGVNNAANTIAQYYVDMARHTFPIIEVDAGRKIDFVISRGVKVGGNMARQQTGNGQNPLVNGMQQLGGAAMNTIRNNTGYGGYGQQGSSFPGQVTPGIVR